jgi:hypothetical protein
MKLVNDTQSDDYRTYETTNGTVAITQEEFQTYVEFFRSLKEQRDKQLQNSKRDAQSDNFRTSNSDDNPEHTIIGVSRE